MRERASGARLRFGRTTAIVGVVALLAGATAGCERGDTGGEAAVDIPVEQILAQVPADVPFIVVLGAGASDAERALIGWYGGAEAAALEELMTELNGVTDARLGIRLPLAGNFGFWVGPGDGGFAGVLLTAYEGTLRTADHGLETPVAEIHDESYLAPVPGGLLFGTRNGIGESLYTLTHGGPTMATSSEATVVALADMLKSATGPLRIGFNLAEVAGGGFTEMLPGALAGVVDASMDRVSLRVRFVDEASASAQAELLRTYLAAALEFADSQAAEMRTDGTVLEAMTSVLARHNAHLLADDLTIEAQANDVLVTVDAQGAAMYVAGVGSAAAVAIPAFIRYRQRSVTTEASMNLRRLFDSAVSYYDADHATITGDIIPAQFPASVPRTPAEVPCGDARAANPDDWTAATWEALNFGLVDPHYYSYQFDSAGVRQGATFTASAFGDLDCDGVLSTFVRTGTVDSHHEIRGVGLFMSNELE